MSDKRRRRGNVLSFPQKQESKPREIHEIPTSEQFQIAGEVGSIFGRRRISMEASLAILRMTVVAMERGLAEKAPESQAGAAPTISVLAEDPERKPS